MKRVLFLVAVAVPLAAAAVYSRQQPAAKDATPASGPAAQTGGVQVAVEARNPWTHLRVNNEPDQFQFVIVTDRTGGHREKIFSRAIQQINLLQPEFVMSVGDLIEGYSKKAERVDAEWKEFQGYTSKFEMPFFYVPGNHDLTNPMQVENWGGRFGRKYYHFVYRDVLFLAVNSEDPVSTISEEQRTYFEKALAENPHARWVMVFLHKPLWTEKDSGKNGWAGMEKLLAGRNYTVFCGHVHRYQKFVRNGMNYYQLATTGGGSRLRGVEYGEFDHIVWVTMKKNGPLLANVMLDGIYPENLKVPESDEAGQPHKVETTYPLTGKVFFDGTAAAGATVRFYRKVTVPKEKFEFVADGVTGGDGSFTVSTYKAFDGIPAGEYAVTVVQTGGYYGGEGEVTNKLPAKFADPQTTPLKAVVKADEKNVVELELMK
jgi:hypothetical protein